MVDKDWTKRTLTTPLKGNGQPIDDQVLNQVGELNVEIDKLNTRLQKLEKAPGGTIMQPSGGRHLDTPDPEFYVDIDRAMGTVQCGDALETPRSMSRAVKDPTQEPEVLPEFYVPVNRKTGTIGGDD